MRYFALWVKTYMFHYRRWHYEYINNTSYLLPLCLPLWKFRGKTLFYFRFYFSAILTLHKSLNPLTKGYKFHELGKGIHEIIVMHLIYLLVLWGGEEDWLNFNNFLINILSPPQDLHHWNRGHKFPNWVLGCMLFMMIMYYCSHVWEWRRFSRIDPFSIIFPARGDPWVAWS